MKPQKEFLKKQGNMAKPTLYTQEMLDKYTGEGYWLPLTISDYWNLNAKNYPHKEAIADSSARLTWAEAKVWIDRLALGFLEMGLKKDEVVVIQLPNCVELACLRVACERAGLLHLPAVRVFRHSEMEHILKYTEAKAIVIPWKYRDFDYFAMVEELKPALPSVKQIIIWGNECPPGTTTIKELISRALESKYTRDYLENKKVPWYEFSLIGTTTGTTGIPKFVEQPICSTLARRGEIEQLELTEKDTLIAMSNAAMGPNAPVYFFAPIVAARVVMLEHWTVEEALSRMEEEKATVMCVVPTQLVEINSYPHLDKFNLSSLRVVFGTGAQMPYHLASELEDKLKCPIINVYGAVDYGGMSGSTMRHPREIRLLTVGKPLPGNELKIIDDAGATLPEGETGRIAFRGAKGASGYYKDPETTAKKWIKDGWYITGDLGRVDESGYLHILGRNDDMIIRGGQNIMPAEVENLLLGHPAIRDAAIVGIPDPLMGQRACACVVARDGRNFSFEEMASFLKGKRIAAFKLPERLLLFDSLPYVSGLKLDRKQLKVMAEKLLNENLHIP